MSALHLGLAFISSIATVSWIGWRDVITQNVRAVENRWLPTMMSGRLSNKCDDNKENCAGNEPVKEV